MARTSRPDSIYKVSLHRNAGHTYAATHPYTLDASGKRRYSVCHWGTVTDDLRFIPGKRYLEASEEERRRLVFPEGWDLSAAEAAAGAGASGGSPAPPLRFAAADASKAFGDVWLLERVVGWSGVREDLCEALGDAARADDLLTLAYYPFLTGTSFLRFSRWQAATKTPSERPLDAMVTESLAAVSRTAFHRFMDLRRTRHDGERLVAVDSVIRHSSGDAVSDRKWGQKTERIHFQSTVEAVAYSMDSHVPVVYSSFPEVVTDARGMGVFRTELARAGLGGITVVTDRGYDSLKGLEAYFQDGPMVMCVDVKQPAVLERIRAFGRFREHPAGMRYDAASRRWYRQYPLATSPLMPSSSVPFSTTDVSPAHPNASAIPTPSPTSDASLTQLKSSVIPDTIPSSNSKNHDCHSERSEGIYPPGAPLRLNLFFNPERRAAELAQIDAEIASQQAALQEIVEYAIPITDRRSLRRDYYFFKTSYNPETQTVTSFTPDKARILDTRAASGFYANITSGLDISPLEAVSIYGLKYDQEKFLRQFRSLLDFPQRLPLSGNLRFGIQLLQYIGLLLNTRLRHSLQHPSQHSLSSGSPLPFRSLTEALDELHNIPCCDAGDGTCTLGHLTPLQQTILDILLPQVDG